MDLPRFLGVICNLIKNAREAMPHGGILTIAISRIDQQIAFRISDTGKGMPPEILAKVFEPFVTHGKSHGTGLGMANRQVGDRIPRRLDIDFERRKSGTTVDVRIPAN